MVYCKINNAWIVQSKNDHDFSRIEAGTHFLSFHIKIERRKKKKMIHFGIVYEYVGTVFLFLFFFAKNKISNVSLFISIASNLLERFKCCMGDEKRSNLFLSICFGCWIIIVKCLMLFTWYICIKYTTQFCIEFLRKNIANPRPFSFWQIHSNAIQHSAHSIWMWLFMYVCVCVRDDIWSGSSLTFRKLNTSECRI